MVWFSNNDSTLDGFSANILIALYKKGFVKYPGIKNVG